MKEWQCPRCHRVREYEKNLVIKVCSACQCEMEVVDDGSN